MALLSDAALSSLSALQRYDSKTAELCASEGINLSQKQELARREVTLQLALALRDELAIFPFPVPDERIARHIVVTERLQHCLDLYTLALVYQDAYANQSNLRLEARYREFQRRADQALANLLDNGVGFVLDPLPRPPRPLVTFFSAMLPAADLVCIITWVNRQGQESEPSPPLAIARPERSALLITPPAAPANAAGWHLYLAASGAQPGRQNNDPLPVSQTWSEPPSGPLSGASPGPQQPPDLFLRRRNILLRG